MIMFMKSAKVAKEGSQWQLMTEAESTQQANLFIRLGTNGQPLSAIASNVLGLTDAQLDIWLRKGAIGVGPLFLLLKKASQDYPDYRVTVAFKQGTIRIFIDGEEIFGFQADRDQYVILNAYGDKGTELCRPEGIESLIKELFAQAKKLTCSTP